MKNSFFKLCILGVVAVVSACGGGGGAAPGAPGASSVSTTISGKVAKGPVAGAQVCAFAVRGTGAGVPLGLCTTTDANGNYSLDVPVDSGLVIVQATGGSYLDEATQINATLPTAVPMTSLVQANGSATTAMITPLTTLALNEAATAVGASATLTLAAFQTGITKVLSTFNLPANLDIVSTGPTFGTSTTNPYGQALVNISGMIKAGTPLPTVLTTTQTAALQAAYSAAASGGGAGGGAGAGAGTGTGTGTGTVVVTGTSSLQVTYSGTASTFKHDIAEAYSASTMYVYAGGGSYSFATTDDYANQERITAEVSADGKVFKLSYTKAIPNKQGILGSCEFTCTAVVSKNAAGRIVGIQFNNSKLNAGFSFAPNYNLVLNGYLAVADDGFMWNALDLPGNVAGAVAVNGVSQVAYRPAYSFNPVQGGTQTSAYFELVDGSTVIVQKNTGAEATVKRVVGANFGNYYDYQKQQYNGTALNTCNSACGVTIADGAEGVTVTFASSPLSGNVTLNGSVFLGKVIGSITSPGMNPYIPGSQNNGFSMSASAGTVEHTYQKLAFAATNTIELLNISTKAGVVTKVSMNFSGNSGSVFNCAAASQIAQNLQIPPCTGATLSADGLTFTFTNVAMTRFTSVNGVQTLETKQLSGSLTRPGR